MIIVSNNRSDIHVLAFPHGCLFAVAYLVLLTSGKVIVSYSMALEIRLGSRQCAAHENPAHESYRESFEMNHIICDLIMPFCIVATA